MADSPKCVGGWCGTNVPKRVFSKRLPLVCYSSAQAKKVDRTKYDDQRYNCLLGSVSQNILVSKRSAMAWVMQPGELCRITVEEESQVGGLNFWNLDNPKEKFFSGKTREFNSTHLTTYDRLWSCLPFLRPMATVVADSLGSYGIDDDGASVHDVMGTRCDQYSARIMLGENTSFTCHSALTSAIAEHGLTESDVHDVWNIFMCTGISKETHKYFSKASPALKGDYIEFIADMPLLVALSACPQGDASLPNEQQVPENKCFPLRVEVFTRKSDNVWSTQ